MMFLSGIDIIVTYPIIEMGNEKNEITFLRFKWFCSSTR